jgi:hypothetical protein
MIIVISALPATSNLPDDLASVIMLRKWLGICTETIAVLLMWFFLKSKKQKSNKNSTGMSKLTPQTSTITQASTGTTSSGRSGGSDTATPTF